MSDTNILTHRLFQVDPSQDSEGDSVKPFDNVNQSHVDEIQRGLFRQYAIEILRFQLALNEKLTKVTEDMTQTKERRYYASTNTRRAFKKLMCLCNLEENSTTAVEVAATLSISHKAATDLIKDALSFGVVTETITNKRKRYAAKSWWVATFFANGVKWAFKNSEQLVRSRVLYNEFARANSTNKVGAPTE
jgi:Fic family protein